MKQLLLVLSLALVACVGATAPAECKRVPEQLSGCTTIAEYSGPTGLVEVRVSIWYGVCPSRQDIPPVYTKIIPDTVFHCVKDDTKP